MIWTRIDHHCIRSEDGMFTITKSFVNGVPIYNAWRGRERLVRAAGDGTPEGKADALRHCKRQCGDGKA